MPSEKVEVEIIARIDKLERELNRGKKSINNFSGVAKSIGSSLAGIFAIGGAVDFARQIIAVRGEFERYQAVLANSRGVAQASKDFAQLKTLAAQLPFSLRELTGSFIRLNNANFTPTTAQLTQLADVGANAGKKIGDVALALQDALTLQFERLPELGIIARREGDKIDFTFKGVTTTVDKTGKAVADYITGLGKLNGVAGTTAAISKTLEGRINNLGDAYDNLLDSLGKIGDARAGGGIIERLTNELNKLGNFANQVDLYFTPLENLKVDVKAKDALDQLALLETRMKALNNVAAFFDVGLIPSELAENIRQTAAAIKAAKDGLNDIGGTTPFHKKYGDTKPIEDTIGKIELLKNEIKQLNESIDKARTEEGIISLKANLDIKQAELDRLERLGEGGLVAKARQAIEDLQKEFDRAGNREKLVTIKAKIKLAEKELENLENIQPKPIGVPVKIDTKRNNEDVAKSIQDELDKIKTLKVDVAVIPKRGEEDLTKVRALLTSSSAYADFDPLQGFSFDETSAELNKLYNQLQAMQGLNISYDDAGFQKLNDRFKELAQAEQQFKILEEAAETFGSTFAESLSKGESALTAFQRAFTETILDIIEKALLAAIANTIASNSILGPLALAAIPAGIAAVKALFNSSIPALAEGGVATRATLAMVGEGREKEAILPLSRLRGLLGEAAFQGNGRGNDNIVATLGIDQIRLANRRSERNIKKITV